MRRTKVLHATVSQQMWCCITTDETYMRKKELLENTELIRQQYRNGHKLEIKRDEIILYKRILYV